MNKYHYKECGLDYIWLCNGFVLHDTRHGKGIAITDAEQLHEAIAQGIINSPNPIRGQEVRFLRSVLDVSQGALGRCMGVTRDAIAKYEAGREEPIPANADHLIRYVYSDLKKDNSLMRGFCDIFEDMEEKFIHKLVMSRGSKGWKKAA